MLTVFGPCGGLLTKYCRSCQILFEDVAFSSEVFSIHIDRFWASWGIFWLNITAVLSQNLFNDVAFSLEVFSIHICHSENFDPAVELEWFPTERVKRIPVTDRNR